MPPLTFLTFILALATGFLSLAWVSRRSHHHYSPVTEALISPLLFYNLWILTWLIRQYVETALLGYLQPLPGRALFAGLIWTSMVAALLWGSSYLTFTLRATHPLHGEAPLRHTRTGVVILAAITGLMSAGLFLARLDPLIRTLSRWLSSGIFLSAAALSLWFFYSAHRRGDGASWRRLRILGAAYSTLFVLLTGFVFWNRYSNSVPRPTATTINVGLEILYNLVTVLWIRFFDRDLPGEAVATPAAMPAPAPEFVIANGFGISKREQEVIQLISRGFTNQEIADTLYISLKTVKDHNYRIFQKTGVRNRVELVQLVREAVASEQESQAAIPHRIG